MQGLVQGLVQEMCVDLRMRARTPLKEYAENTNKHAPRLGNTWKTLEDVLEDVHAA